ncbi:hypothetical protein D3C85_1391720 [compost metagenome]
MSQRIGQHFSCCCQLSRWIDFAGSRQQLAPYEVGGRSEVLTASNDQPRTQLIDPAQHSGFQRGCSVADRNEVCCDPVSRSARLREQPDQLAPVELGTNRRKQFADNLLALGLRNAQGFRQEGQG